MALLHLAQSKVKMFNFYLSYRILKKAFFHLSHKFHIFYFRNFCYSSSMLHFRFNLCFVALCVRLSKHVNTRMPCHVIAHYFQIHEEWIWKAVEAWNAQHFLVGRLRSDSHPYFCFFKHGLRSCGLSSCLGRTESQCEKPSNLMKHFTQVQMHLNAAVRWPHWLMKQTPHGCGWQHIILRGSS